MRIKRDYYYKIINSVEFLYDLYPSGFSKLIGYYYDSQINYSIQIKELNCIYIPIPKVGTKSVKKVLADYLYNEHSDRRFDQSKSPKKELPFKKVDKASLPGLKNENFIFTFVRNPYERILSCFFDKINKKTSYIGFLRYEKKFYLGMTFEEFIEKISEIPDSQADQHFRSQYKFLVDEKNDLIPDYVGKLENMSSDFRNIIHHLDTDKLELAHINKSKAKKIDFETYFTPTVIQIIQQRYEEDFRRFNYPTDIQHYT